jgi:hypothetical protein
MGRGLGESIELSALFPAPARNRQGVIAGIRPPET